VKPDNIRRLRKTEGELPAYITGNGQHAIIVVDGDWHLFQRVGKFDTRRSAAKFAELVADEAPIEMEAD
jgi:hypothetical protein